MSGSAPRIRRGFVEIDEGQVHYREAGKRTAGMPTLVMLHASPGSAKTLEPLMRALAAHRHVIAPDTLGNGDSAPPLGDTVELPYFAGAHLRAIRALGIDRCDLYGTHTGGNIAIEIALAEPQRVRALILDGVSLYTDAERDDMLANYLPKVTIDAFGSQFHLLWNFVRDVYLFWPWYRRDAAHRRAVGMPGADDLHEKALEVLKAATTFHIPYRAALAYRKELRIPLLRVPTLLACAENDMLLEYLPRVRELLPAAESVVTRGVGSAEAAAETARAFESFLDRQQR